MAYTIIAALIVASAFVLAVIAWRMLFKRHWFMAWVRGMLGFCLIALAATLSLAALDVYSYQQLNGEQAIAKLRFEYNSPHSFDVSIETPVGEPQRYPLNGDLWQLDVKVLTWNTRLAALGLQPGYRLDQLSGRYYSLEDEHSKAGTVYDLGRAANPLILGLELDVWSWLQQDGRLLAIIDAGYGTASYLPMKDGAEFTISLAASGLVVRPLNEAAKAAVSQWQ